VFLGDMKFPDLKRVLNQAGIEVEFSAGVLVCAGGAVTIRRVSKTQLKIEGVLCEEYYRVRTLLYSQYKII